METETEMIKQGLLRQSKSTFGRNAGRWQYKARDGMYTTTYSQENAAKMAMDVISAQSKCRAQ